MKLIIFVFLCLNSLLLAYENIGTVTAFNFLQGVFKSITGKIGKINPEKFKIKTKSAAIGIRGTTFFGTLTPNMPEDIACTQGEMKI